MTIYNGGPDQLLDKTYAFVSGVNFISGWADTYTALQTATTTDYNYGTGIYLLASAVARGRVQPDFTNTVAIQSMTIYNGGPDQLLDKTYAFVSGVNFISGWADTYTALQTATTTDYNYGTGIYLLASAVARGRVQPDFTNTVAIQSMTI